MTDDNKPKKHPPTKVPLEGNENPQSDIELLKSQLDQSSASLAEMTETCKRTLADFANYKRLVDDQRKQAAWFGTSSMISEILPIIDNFERALAHMTDLDSAHREGMQAIYRQLIGLLEKHNVKKIETVGKPFNPLFHEVLSQAPGPLDTIIEEFEKGYTMGDQVLKPAKVIVGNGQ